MSNPETERFFEAVRSGDFDSVVSQVTADPSLVDERASDGASAIQVAVYSFQRPIADWLAGQGATLDLPSACCLGAVARIRAHSGSFDELSPDGFAPIALASAFGGSEAVQALVETGADVNLRSRALGGVAAVHAAVFGRQSQSLQLLLESGADPNLTQEGGFTPLMGAAMNGDEIAVRLLLEHGADPEARSADGKTAREWAVSAGHEALAGLL